MLDIYDKNGKHIGTMERNVAHSTDIKGVFHKGVHTWIINDKGEVLVQLRAKDKRENPNKWDISSAGHVDAGETLIDTCQRELYEELGIDMPTESFIYQGEILGRSGNEFHQLYLLKADVDVKDMKLDPKEVAEVNPVYCDW